MFYKHYSGEFYQMLLEKDSMVNELGKSKFPNIGLNTLNDVPLLYLVICFVNLPVLWNMEFFEELYHSLESLTILKCVIVVICMN